MLRYMRSVSSAIRQCRCCGLVQECPEGGAGAWDCARCGTHLHDAGSATRRHRAAALAATALVCYIPAVSWPISELEQLGRTMSASVWVAATEFLAAGDYLVGGIILFCSVVLPLVKLLLILGVGLGARWWPHRWRAVAWHTVELTGRWGMIDVLLVAILVAWIKIGDLVAFAPGPGLAMFCVMVVLSLVAAASCHPQDLWAEDDQP